MTQVEQRYFKSSQQPIALIYRLHPYTAKMGNKQAKYDSGRGPHETVNEHKIDEADLTYFKFLGGIVHESAMKLEMVPLNRDGLKGKPSIQRRLSERASKILQHKIIRISSGKRF
jgi:hypothetical protein